MLPIANKNISNSLLKNKNNRDDKIKPILIAKKNEENNIIITNKFPTETVLTEEPLKSNENKIQIASPNIVLISKELEGKSLLKNCLLFKFRMNQEDVVSSPYKRAVLTPKENEIIIKLLINDKFFNSTYIYFNIGR